VRHIGDGGIPGAVLQPDGTYAIPESVAVVGPVHLHEGAACAAAGWHEYDEHGNPTNVVLPNYAENPAAVADADLIENVAMATTAKARSAAKRKAEANAKAKKKSSKAKRKVRPAKTAQVAGAVTVELAGFTGFPDTPDNPERLVVRVTTGQLSGPATLRMRADVLKQPSMNVPENRW
jgi:cytoskeletal protein RodZ